MRLWPPRRRRVLVAGWFSLDHQGATAGDLIAGELVRDWIEEAGIRCDMALGAPFEGGVDWRRVRPRRYEAVAVVCGPVAPDMPIAELIRRFSGRRLVGVNLSVLRPPGEWDPWTELLARDGHGDPRPDVTLAAPVRPVPVVARVEIHLQGEYEGAAPHLAHAAFDRLLAGREAASLPVDTRLDMNGGGLRTPAEVEALIARADVVLTTRLHGLALALKVGVPALAVDPVPGGAKVSAQAVALGWPHAFLVDSLDDAALARSFEECLAPAARELARACGERGAREAAALRERVTSAVAGARNGAPTRPARPSGRAPR